VADATSGEVSVLRGKLSALELNVQTLLDPQQSHALLVFTAVSGSETHEKLRLLPGVRTPSPIGR
jgi:hypothetical protein